MAPFLLLIPKTAGYRRSILKILCKKNKAIPVTSREGP
jgi:hypothetical protein